MRSLNICRFIMVFVLLLCTALSSASADTYHTFNDIPFGMSLDDFKQWLEDNTTNEHEPLQHEYEQYMSYSTMGEFHIDSLNMTGILVQAIFVDDIGLSNILLTIKDANYFPEGHFPEDNEREGIARAINEYLRIVDTFVEVYGPWDDGIFRKSQEEKYTVLTYPGDHEAFRSALLACEGASIRLRFDNVFIFYGSSETYLVGDLDTKAPGLNAQTNITYWGPGMQDVYNEMCEELNKYK